MSSPKLYMVFDVESVGLSGEGFAVAWCVVGADGAPLASAAYACNPELAHGSPEDLKWVQDNVTLPVGFNCESPLRVRDEFWDAWQYAKARGAELWADCNFPVETNFLAACIADKPYRSADAPYPFFDLTTLLKAVGKDPVGNFGRQPNELPAHNPLCDARQSARVLIETLNLLAST